ncbi:hypothetical protein CONPUDRAFT_169429, partial [Coniophora puteana RWD-64-598 SS2]
HHIDHPSTTALFITTARLHHDTDFIRPPSFRHCIYLYPTCTIIPRQRCTIPSATIASPETYTPATRCGYVRRRGQ